MQRSHLGAWNELQIGTGTHPGGVTETLEQTEQSTTRVILSPALTPSRTNWFLMRVILQSINPLQPVWEVVEKS